MSLWSTGPLTQPCRFQTAHTMVFFTVAQEEEGAKQDGCLEKELSVDAETAFPNLSMV